MIVKKLNLAGFMVVEMGLPSTARSGNKPVVLMFLRWYGMGFQTMARSSSTPQKNFYSLKKERREFLTIFHLEAR